MSERGRKKADAVRRRLGVKEELTLGLLLLFLSGFFGCDLLLRRSFFGYGLFAFCGFLGLSFGSAGAEDEGIT